MPTVKYSIDSRGAETGAQRFSAAMRRIVTDAQNAARAIGQLDKQFSALRNTSTASRELAVFVRHLQGVPRAAGPATQQVSGFVKAMRDLGSASVLAFGPLSGIGARFTTIGALAARSNLVLGGVIATITGLGVAVGSSVKAAADFEAAMLRVAKVTDASSVELRRMSEDILRMSSSLGIPAEELAVIEERAAQLGIRGASNLALFTEQVALLTRTTNLGAEQAAEQFGRFLQLTHSSVSDIRGFAAALVALGNNFNATESEILSITEELSRAGTAFNVGGDQLLSLGAALASVGERAERSATAMSQTLVRITQAATSGGPQLQRFADAIGLSAEKFQELARTNIGEVVFKLLEALQNAGPGAAQMLKDLEIGSERNVKVFLSLAQNLDQMRDALRITTEQLENPTAAMDEFQRMSDGLNRQIEILKTNLHNLAIAFGTPLLPAINDAVNGLNNFLLKLQGIDPAVQARKKSLQQLAEEIGDISKLDPLGVDRRFDLARSTLEFAQAERDLNAVAQAAAVVSGHLSNVNEQFGLLSQKPRDVASAVAAMIDAEERAAAQYDRNAAAVKGVLAALDEKIKATALAAKHGKAAAIAQEEITKLEEKGIKISADQRNEILKRAEALVRLQDGLKATKKESDDSVKAIEKLQNSLDDVARDLDKQFQITGLTQTQAAVVELQSKLEDLRITAVRGGADEATARELVNAAYERALPRVQALAAEKEKEYRNDVLEKLRQEIELRRIEVEQGTVAAATQRAINEAKEQGITITDEWVDAVRAANEELESFREQSTVIADAFEDFIAGIAQGTQELSLDGLTDAFKAAFAATIREKLQFDEIFKGNLLDLVDWAAKLFSGGAINIGGLFSFGGGGAGLLGGGSLFGSGGGGLLGLLLGGVGPILGGIGGTLGAGGNIGVGAGLTGASVFATQGLRYLLTNSEYAFKAAELLFGERGTAKLVGSGVRDLTGLLNDLAGAGLGFGIRLGGGAVADALGASSRHDATGQLATSIASTVLQAVGSVFLGPIGGALLAAINDVIDPFIHELFGLFQKPTEGTIRRMGGESFLTSLPTFAALEEQLGDITRKRYRLRDNPDLPRQREKLGPDALLDVSGFAGIFAQLAFGGEDGGKHVAGIVEEWTNILTDFFSRMEGSSEEVGLAIRQNLAQAFREMGVDAADAMGIINDLAQNLLTSPDPTYFGEAVSNVTNLGETIRGTAAIFESELPRGVHIAALALETMRKDGVAAFTDLSKEGRQNLLDLTRDAEAFDQVVAMLFADGFQINTDEFKTRLADITASAEFIGQSIGDVFTGPSVAAGIEAMGQQLRELVTNSFRDEALGQLFDTTNIAASFEPVFAVLRQLKEGAFDLTSATGLADFKNQIAVAIAEGRANLDEFIPQLRAIRDAARDLDELIEEALKPTDVEAFWLYLEEQFKANKEAVEGMAASLFEVAVAAEMVVPGSGRDAARAAIDQQIDQTAFSAVQAAAGEFALKSPQGEALAALTTEFQAKVAAAFQDGVITAEEKLELAQLKQKMDEAGQVLADSVSGASAELADLFEADRLKELTEQASAALKSSVGSAADSMFDVIAKGGSTGEGIQAFAESFRSSVRENVLQGMQEALVQSVLLESALAPLMAAMKDGMAKALEDGIITADEQAWLDAIATGILETTDSTIAALTPTLEKLGGIAQTVAGNTEKADVKITELDRQTQQVDGAISEMARRAARNLEQVGDAVSEDVTGSIKEGLGSLAAAIGEDGGPSDKIKTGLGALVDAFGGGASGSAGGPAEIKAGMDALVDAFGGGASGSAGGPAEIKAGMDALVDAFGGGASGSAGGPAEMIKAGMDALVGAFGGGASGSAGGPAEMIKAGMDALVGAFGGDGGGAPEEIRAGLQALRDAFGPDASPAEIEAGLLKMQSALGNELIDPIARGIDTLRDALGNTNTGAASAASDLATAMREALRPAATEVAGVLQDDLQRATENVAASLSDQFASGLNTADEAVRRFAQRLSDCTSVLPADPPPADPVPGAAMGGTFASGAAVVGEAGRPELVIARPGGGFEVIPLDHATAFALMRGGIPGFAAGGAIPPGTRQRPGPGSGWGPGGPWVTNPNDPRHPDYIRPAAEGEALKVQIEIRSQLEEYFQSGDFAAFTEQWERSVNEAIAKGILDAILETGPIARGIERLNAVLSREIEKAWRDGSLTDDEIARIKERAAELGAPIVETVRKLGPELQGLFADLGLGESVASDLRGALEGAFRTFATGGSVDDLRQSIHEAFREATINGIIDGLLLEGPIAEAIAGVSEGFHAALSAAMEDGIISEEEAANLQALAAGLGTHLEQVFAGLDPAITALFEGMRNRAAEAAAQAGELITGAFRSIINDPEKLNFESFSQTLRTSLYQNIAGGLIDAFMDAAIVQGALAPMLQAIQEIFDQIGQKQLSIAEANGLIAEQIAAINGVLEDPTFKSAIDEMLKGISGIATQLDAFPRRTEEVATAASEVSDAIERADKDVCAGKCDLKEQVIELGEARLDAFGRIGAITDTEWRYVPRFARGGIVRRPTFGLIGEYGPEIVAPLHALTDVVSSVDSGVMRALRDARERVLDGYLTSMSTTTHAPSASDAETVQLLGELIGEIHQMRREASESDEDLADRLEDLLESIANRPIKTSVRVGMAEVIELLHQAHRTAERSGVPIGG